MVFKFLPCLCLLPLFQFLHRRHFKSAKCFSFLKFAMFSLAAIPQCTHYFFCLEYPHPLAFIICLLLFFLNAPYRIIFTGNLFDLHQRQWQHTPVLLPGESHGRRSLVGCSPWGRQELDMTERLHFHFSLSCIGEGNGNPVQCSCLENPRDGEPGGLPSPGSHRVGHD